MDCRNHELYLSNLVYSLYIISIVNGYKSLVLRRCMKYSHKEKNLQDKKVRTGGRGCVDHFHEAHVTCLCIIQTNINISCETFYVYVIRFFTCLVPLHYNSDCSNSNINYLIIKHTIKTSS